MANFVIMWVGYKSSVLQNQGNGLEGRNFDFDEVDDFVKESYDGLSAEGKQVVGEYVDDVGGITGPTGSQYSVGYKMKLPDGTYSGTTRGLHFQEANKALLNTMSNNSQFANAMEKMIPGISDFLKKTPMRSTTSLGWTWHHNIETGIMELVPYPQHTSSLFQAILHPGGKGGFAIWNK